MKRCDQIKKTIEELFKDKRCHDLTEIRERCTNLGIDIESDKNAISNVVFKMKKDNILRSTGEKGVYELVSPNELADSTADHIRANKAASKTASASEGKINSKPGGTGKAADLNWNEFFVLKPDDTRHQEMRLTVTEKGEMRLNSRLQKNLPNKNLQMIFSNDYKFVLLNPDGEDAHVFTKAGTTKNRGLAEVFLKMKMKFPVAYIIKWDEEHEMWKGKLDITDKK